MCSRTRRVTSIKRPAFLFQNGTLTGEQQSPQPNFGDVPNADINLQGATALTFWARGESGGEQVQFFLGGAGRNAQSATRYGRIRIRRLAFLRFGTTFTLTASWQQFSIPITGDLTYVLGGFRLGSRFQR